jgi:hypothetical protein
MMSLSQAISELYRVSKTPAKDYSLAKIEEIIDTTDSEPDSKSAYLDVVLFLLSLFDTRSDLTGAGYMSYFLIPSLNFFSLQSKISEHRASTIRGYADAWCIALKDTVKHNAILRRKLLSDVDGIKSPLYRFHLEASDIKEPRRNRIRHLDQRANRKPLNSELSTLYSAYAPRIHYCIRQFMQKKIEEENKLEEKKDEIFHEYLYAARCFFYFMPESFKRAQCQPAFIPEQYLNAFVEQYDFHVHGRLSRVNKPDGREFLKISLRAALYDRKFRELIEIDNTLIKRIVNSQFPIDFQATAFTYDLDDLDMNATIYGHADDIPLRLETVSYLFPPIVDEGTEKENAGEAPFSIDRLGSAVGDDIVKFKPSIKRSWIDFIDLRKYFFWWDSSYLTLWHYARLYEMLHSTFDENKQCQNNALSAFIMILIHTGMNILQLASTRISQDPAVSATDSPVVTRKDKRFVLITLSPIQRVAKESPDGCMPASEQVRFPLPTCLDNFLENIFLDKKEFLFSYIDNEAYERKIDLTMIRAFISSKDNDLGFKCSLEFIRSSFLPLYSSRFGLDPFHACYISGSHYGIFQAPLHYVYIERNALNKDYDTISKVVDKEIRSLSHLPETDFSSFYKTPRAAVPSSRGGYGPSRMPKIKVLESIIKKIGKKIKHFRINEFHKRHNLFMVYLYIGLMLATGLRPRNNPEIPWHGFNRKLGVLVLSDKLSPKFYEERVVPVVEPISTMIDDLRKRFDDFCNVVILYHKPSFAFAPEHLFFLFDRNYAKLDFTLKEVRQVLTDEGIGFPFPLNAPRHCLRTAFHKEGIHHELSAMFMGHMSAGKEWLAEFSAVDFEDCDSEYKKIAVKTLIDYGYQRVSYRPR